MGGSTFCSVHDPVKIRARKLKRPMTKAEVVHHAIDLMNVRLKEPQSSTDPRTAQLATEISELFRPTQFGFGLPDWARPTKRVMEVARDSQSTAQEVKP